MNDGLITRALWTAEDAAQAAGGRLQGPDSWIATGVSIDTRSIEPGDLFVALKAERDGHAFLAEAFAKGAAAALVSDAAAAEAAPGPTIVAPETLAALEGLGRTARARTAARVCAITGSVGKTSVKEALAACLSATGRTHHAVKSFNNHIGVPLTLARTPADAAFAVYEAGMNHAGEIAPLAQLIRPHVAIITTIAAVHLEALGSVAAIAAEKAEIFGGLTRDGVALVPADAPHADVLIARARSAAAAVALFGRGPECDARLLSFAPDAEGSTIEADVLGKPLTVRIGAPGAPWALNGLAVLAAACLMGGDLEPSLEALAALKPAPGRGAARAIPLADGGNFTLVDDAYNASPVSVAAALETLQLRPVAAGGRRIAVLGDMLELGPDEAVLHAGLAEAAARADLVFACGPRMAHLWEALPNDRRGGYAGDSEALAPLVTASVRGGDVVMVKGSFGSRMGRVVDALAGLARA